MNMEYDEAYWNKYALENENRYNQNFAQFVSGLVTSLRCQSVLEIGCGTGIDLRMMPDNIRILGMDVNILALQIARTLETRGDFRVGDITQLPLADSSVDMVFTHQLLNYLDDDTLEAGMAEMYRISRSYIMSCEVYRKDEAPVSGAYRYRDMARRWQAYRGNIISNVSMHPDIEPDEPRFVLVKKFPSE